MKAAYIFCTLSGDPVDQDDGGKLGSFEGPHRLIETGHWPMITKPEQLARDMLDLA